MNSQIIVIIGNSEALALLSPQNTVQTIIPHHKRHIKFITAS